MATTNPTNQATTQSFFSSSGDIINYIYTTTPLSVIDNSGTEPLDIAVTNLNTICTAPSLTWSTGVAISQVYNAQVILFMDYSNVTQAFKYSNDSQGFTALYFDPSNLVTCYPYFSTNNGITYNSVSPRTGAPPVITMTSANYASSKSIVTTQSSTNSNPNYNAKTSVLGINKSNCGFHNGNSESVNMSWNGFINNANTTNNITNFNSDTVGNDIAKTNTTSPDSNHTKLLTIGASSSGISLPSDNYGDGGVSQDMLVPMSWDYIFFLAKSIFGTWSSFPFFEEVDNQEIILQQAINTAINRTLYYEIQKVDANDASLGNYTSITGSSSYNPNLSNLTKDASGNPCVMCVQDNFTNDIMSTIFNTLLKYRPERFINNNLANCLYSYPLYPGDTIGFTVTVNPATSQQYIGQSNSFAYQAGNTSNSSQQGSTNSSGTRIYYVTMVINSSAGNISVIALESYISQCNQYTIFANNTASILYSITNSLTQITYQLNSALQAYYTYLYDLSGVDISMNQMLKTNVLTLFNNFIHADADNIPDNDIIVGTINNMNINVNTLYTQYNNSSSQITVNLTTATTLLDNCTTTSSTLNNTLNNLPGPKVSNISNISEIPQNLIVTGKLTVSGLTAAQSNLSAAINLTNSVFSKGTSAIIMPNGSGWTISNLQGLVF